MVNYAPVAVFAYTRLEHLKQTLQSLNDADLANETELFIFCDNYKTEKDRVKVENVRKYVSEFSKSTNFKSVTIKKAAHNMGLKNSIISGVSELMNGFGCAIVVEDDLQVSKFFLRYMNDALTFYKNNNKVWAVSGYSFPMKALNNYKYDIYFTGRGCSWGWGSWSDRWNSIDWSVSDYGSFKHNWKKRLEFSKWGADLPTMLDAQMISNINSWAVIWCYNAFKQNMLTVYPRESFIKNLGNDGSGTHGSTSDIVYETFLYNEAHYAIEFANPFLDSLIEKEFFKKYTGSFGLFAKDQIKGLLRRTGLYKRHK